MWSKKPKFFNYKFHKGFFFFNDLVTKIYNIYIKMQLYNEINSWMD